MAEQYDGLGGGAQFQRPQAPFGDPSASVPPPGYAEPPPAFPPPTGQPLSEPGTTYPGYGTPGPGYATPGPGYAAQNPGSAPGGFGAGPQFAGAPTWTPQQPPNPQQQSRRRSGFSRFAMAIGSVTAIAALAAGSGLLNTSPIATTGGTNGPITTAPAQGGSSEASDEPATDDPTLDEPGADDGTQFPELLPGSGGWQGSGGASETSTSTGQQRVTAAQSKGVVLIKATTPSSSGAGSGMVIDPSGLVLTNYHVVHGSTSVRVTIAATKKTYTATVVGHDATNDVALLKLEGASGLDVVTIDDDAVRAGDEVTAVGNANGQGFLTAAPGEVTDTDSTVTVSNDSASGKETLRNVYETNAQAQPGDSGGPMFDAETEVTGVTTAGEQTYAGGGRSGGTSPKTVASYAIPIARAMTIVEQIKAGDDSATVHIGPRPYLGITVASRSGATVASVQSGQPAEEVGITAGSQLTSIAGKPVSTQADIAAALADYNPDEVVAITWVDPDGEQQSAELKLAASPVN